MSDFIWRVWICPGFVTATFAVGYMIGRSCGCQPMTFRGQLWLWLVCFFAWPWAMWRMFFSREKDGGA